MIRARAATTLVLAAFATITPAPRPCSAAQVVLTQSSVNSWDRIQQLGRLLAKGEDSLLVVGEVYLSCECERPGRADLCRRLDGQALEWRVRELTFLAGSRIYLCGTTLSLKVENAVAVEGTDPLVFASWISTERKARSGIAQATPRPSPPPQDAGTHLPGLAGKEGVPGSPGNNGRTAGSLVLRLSSVPDLPFRIDLVGQSGGDGARGGPGGPGGAAGSAQRGISRPSGKCTPAPQRGGSGGTGGAGGKGGDGGQCGDAGEAIVLVPSELADAFKARISSTWSQAEPGIGGMGGDGGDPGEPGAGVPAYANCPAGDPGSQGERGRDGQSGRNPGAACKPTSLKIVELAQ